MGQAMRVKGPWDPGPPHPLGLGQGTPRSWVTRTQDLGMSTPGSSLRPPQGGAHTLAETVLALRNAPLVREVKAGEAG